jgi:hypothetical protein
MQMMIFKRGLDHRLQIQLAGVPFQTLDELVIKTRLAINPINQMRGFRLIYLKLS